MADQTTLNRNGEAPATAVREGLAEIAHDALLLAELQAKLVAADLRGQTKTAVWTAALAGGALFMLPSITTMGLLAVAAWLEQSGWRPAATLGVAAMIGLVVAAALCVAAYVAWRSRPRLFAASRQELAANLAWLRSALSRGSRHRAGQMQDKKLS